jgi:ABC-2 type transport system ATP-binding protein
MEIIRITEVKKSYRGVEALRGIDLSIAEGELFGFIGPDGAGKTTLMRAMCTLIRPDEGHILIRGLDVTKNVSRMRSSVGYMPQRFSLYRDLSVEQNLRFYADLFGVRRDERDRLMEELYRFSRLAAFRHRRADELSGGMKQKLALSCALVHRPDILVLDEPTFGVDPISRAEFWDLLGRIRADGTTIVISTAYMDEADRCDRVALMFAGRAVAVGRPGELKARFRYPLYRITGSDVRDIRDFFRKAGVARDTQLFGDSVHVSFAEDPDGALWRRWQGELGGRIERWERQAPGIEDVFLELIRSG